MCSLKGNCVRRLIVATFIGLLAAVICFNYQLSFERGAGDISWARCAGLALLNAGDPYACRSLMSSGLPGPTNPLTTALVLIPIVWLPPELMAATFIGISSMLLSWSLTAEKQWWRLGVFLALPFWESVMTVQWAPLFLAIAYLPLLLPLTLCKPHLGLVVALPNLN